MRHLKSLLPACALLLQSAAGLAAPLESGHLQSFGEVEYLDFHSTGLQRSFHVFVDLPGSYAASEASYPVIYLLDGGNTFPLIAAFHHYLRLGDEAPEAILVGISYGSDTFTGGNMRQTDFTAPSNEREFWGGAGAFQAMLAEELMPLVEGRYRSDPGRRILFGQSLGGQFVIYSALTRPQLFCGHIASNPALHRNLDYFLRWRGPGEPPDRASRLFVSSGEFDAELFLEPASAWIRHWQAQDVRPWQLETRVLEGQTHFSAAPEAFRQGLAWLFSDQCGWIGG